MLDKQAFLNVVDLTPLVSIDLVIRSETNAILMGERLNEPAAGYWFVPGGRIFKNETLEQAFRRITRAELGIELEISQGQLLGGFTHLYDTNFAKAPGIGTHYVVLAYQLRLPLSLDQLPSAQHSGYRWLGEHDDLSRVHANSLAYFPYLR
ncbi:GDP-mannose mannosyl hydrolase [Methylomonas sp. UP202]|uniref:GDP-mannose mannosyl hydrolase n=1 Tax=Methylomonas sp. UP202 TaxID=3040943 RepID=UPI00247A315B|nr:GDP-mannose mannosyl hydrolase [Methylomonas sp. UP202]WGS84397.1 GDP-mannose mannosyl hydrolase [Methylomonas sp. UP202]